VSKFKAQINAHADLTEDKMRRVVVNAIQELLQYITTSAPGVTAGGTRIEGKFPVVSSDLIRSLVSELNGGQVGSGQDSYSVALANYEVGQFLRFAWTSEYALRIELGFTGTDSAGRTYQQEGWHMVGTNVSRWPVLVEKHARINA